MSVEPSGTRPESAHSFRDLASRAFSRRDFVRTGLGSLAVSFFTVDREVCAAVGVPFGFTGVPVSDADSVSVPDTYAWQVLYAWGDPVDGESPRFKPDATNSADEQARQAGMGHDGIEWFPWPGDAADRTDRGLLVMNHEYTDPGLLFPDGLESIDAEKVRKSQAAHGVSVIAVQREGDRWRVVPSPWTRRITASEPMEFTGPAAGSVLLRTAADPEGMRVLGTFNNCASGKTPWGTYLTCEENVNGYFGSDASGFSPDADMRRYGFAATGSTADVNGVERPLHSWWKHDGRFDLHRNPHESNRCGFVVEIDPAAPGSVPHKHTALGRMKHENAAVTLGKDQRVVVYMGDDERNEYIYKFVSSGAFDPAEPDAGRGLLAEGILHVARFLPGGKGEWIPLIHAENGLVEANGFASQADICVRTRQAADKVGATMMDRPEWIAIHPISGQVFVALTNNDRRGTEPVSGNAPGGTTAASGARPATDDANPRANNVFGHIIRWDEAGGDAASLTFEWDVFLLAGDPAVDPTANVKGDAFGSPDGLAFDARGILWIQTDVSTSLLGKGPYGNLGNNMMLAADPATGTVRRFLTGPKGCEITGLAFTPDLKTLFVNIQHPGEPSGEASDPRDPKAVSAWPDGASGGRPRSATIAISNRAGKAIGS